MSTETGFFHPSAEPLADFQRLQALAYAYGYHYVRLLTVLETQHRGVEGPATLYTVLVAPSRELMDTPDVLMASAYAFPDIETNLTAQFAARRNRRPA